MRLPVPNDWNEEDNGHILVMMCIPNSQMWRAIIRGRIWDLTGWADWDPTTGQVTPAQAIVREIFNSMGMCKLDDLLIEFKRLNAILAGEELTVVREGVTLHWDYQAGGVVPALEDISLTGTVAKLEEMRTLYETRSIAETIALNSNFTQQRYVLQSLITAVNGLDMGDDTDLIAKLEELRTMLETRSIAETTAANTRNTALIKAVGEIDATTTVNLNNTNGCGDCGDCADCSGDAFSVQVQE